MPAAAYRARDARQAKTRKRLYPLILNNFPPKVFC